MVLRGLRVRWANAVLLMRLRWWALVLWAGRMPRGWRKAVEHDTYRSVDGWKVKRYGWSTWAVVSPDGVRVTCVPRWQTGVVVATALYGAGKVRP